MYYSYSDIVLGPENHYLLQSGDISMSAKI